MSETRQTAISTTAATSAGTSALAATWAGLLTYWGIANAMRPSPPIALFVTLSTALLVVWAVAERRRWARYTMLLIAGYSLIDVMGATLVAATASPVGLVSSLVSGHAFGDAVACYGVGKTGGVCVVGAWLWAVVWMSLRPVRDEFHWRKPSRTSRAQMVIGLVLLTVDMPGMIAKGAIAQSWDRDRGGQHTILAGRSASALVTPAAPNPSPADRPPRHR